jgi:hypothetical protein
MSESDQQRESSCSEMETDACTLAGIGRNAGVSSAERSYRLFEKDLGDRCPLPYVAVMGVVKFEFLDCRLKGE